MSNQNGRIYIDTSTTPHKGISIADIQTVLGSQRNDIGGLIVNGNINPWAKYKPTRANGLNPADWWKGEIKSIYGSATGGYTYGFSISEYTSLANLKSAMDSNNFGWVYEKPRGASYGTNGEWFRFLDFNEYINNATCPFTSVGVAGDEYPTIDDSTISLIVDFVRTDGSIGAADFTLFDGWYFGIAVYGGGSGRLVGKGTSTVSFDQHSDASRLVRMTLPVRAQGTCYLYPFFSYNQIAWSDAESEPAGNQRYIPLPIGREEIKVVSGGLLAGLTFAFGTGGTINYRASDGRLTITFPALSVTNTNNSPRQIAKGNIYYQVYTQKIADTSSRWESVITTMGISGAVQIASGATETVFSSGTSNVLSNPSGTGTIAGSTSTMNLFTFISNAGGSFMNDYATTILMWYWDPNHSDYLPMDAYPPFTYDPA